MWLIETFYLAGGTLLVVSFMHLIVFWVARFLYPPQPKKVVQFQQPVVQQQAPVVNPVLMQQAAPPMMPAVQIPQVTQQPSLPSSYVEATLQTQVPTVNNEPLPPPVQVGKRSENE